MTLEFEVLDTLITGIGEKLEFTVEMIIIFSNMIIPIIGFFALLGLGLLGFKVFDLRRYMRNDGIKRR